MHARSSELTFLKSAKPKWLGSTATIYCSYNLSYKVWPTRTTNLLRPTLKRKSRLQSPSRKLTTQLRSTSRRLRIWSFKSTSKSQTNEVKLPEQSKKLCCNLKRNKTLRKVLSKLTQAGTKLSKWSEKVNCRRRSVKGLKNDSKRNSM